MGDKVVTGITLPLDSAVREAAAFTSANVREDLNALRETVLLLKDSLVKAIEVSDRNSGIRVAERTYEPSSQPKTICGNDVVGAGLLLGEKTLSQAHTDILERAMERPKRFKRSVDFVSELSSDDAYSPATILSLGVGSGARTYSLEETASAQKLMERMTNALPPPKLEDEFLESPAGKNYQASLNDYELNLALYQAVLARGIAERAPTIGGLEEWAKNKWLEMGGTGDPPGLVDGMISQETLFWYLTNMRLSSANWHEEGLSGLPEAGLLREIAAMQAVNIELLRRQNEILRDLSNIMALIGISNLQGVKRSLLFSQYTKAEASANGGN
jgi:hypothetical protein